VSRDPVLPPEEDEPPPPSSPRLQPTPPAALVALALVGLVVGWALRPLSVWLGRPAPQVGWMPPLGLLLVAAVIGWTAWLTYRSVHRRHPRRDATLAPIEPHQAVNRLALAKACALVGALVTGGYLGFCLSWVGLRAEVALPRVVPSLAAAVAAGLLVGASLLLERACRVRNDGE
jgi:hypothetical protein